MTSVHIDDHGAHVDQIDARLRDLRDAFGGLSSSDDFDELLRIIHGQGWTTPAELFLFGALIEEVQVAVKTATRLRQGLLDGAVAITRGVQR